ncbi:MAG: hypothetical protein QM790_04025 [Nibricoccus sp.]
MISSLRKFISWAFLKLVFGAFIVCSATVILSLWLFLRDRGDFESNRSSRIAGLKEERATAALVRDAAAESVRNIHENIDATAGKIERAAKIITVLEEQQTWWNRWFGNRDQSKRNAAGIARMRDIQVQASSDLNKLKRELRGATKQLEQSQNGLRKLDENAERIAFCTTPATYYVFLAWDYGRWIFLGLALLYFVGPTLRKLFLFYYVAPRLGRSRGFRFARPANAFPWLGESKSVVTTSLWPGETARVRLRYLRSVDDGVLTESRMLMSWRFPLISLLSGFVHDVNLRNVRAGNDYDLVFEHHKNPENQMAVVHVPEGGSLVVRPSFLAAVILPPGQKLKFKPRWQLFRWQAWVTGQLRFLECIGPCRLVVAGRPGLRAERLEQTVDGSIPTCRTAQDKIVGFTPNLEYRLIRTARFWSYYRWGSLLFDASFTGTGFVLLQTSAAGQHHSLLTNTRHRARRVLGL